MVERFFNGSSSVSSTTVAEHSQGGCCITSDPIMLLSGPPSSGKTSLLFQYALNMAGHCQLPSQRYVVFICNCRRFETKPPFLSQGIDASSDILQRILIKYIDDYDDEGIKKYFASFHLLPHFPCAVIIDDFGDFFHDSNCQQRYSNSRGRDLAMIRILALCHSAITHANKTTTCQLLVSDTHLGDSPRHLFIYKRWISSIFTIQGEGDGSGSFLLEHSVHVTERVTRKRRARYSIALQYLILEEIINDVSSLRLKHSDN
ncbi:Regulatory protein NPR3 [Bienertia sinuspersici]